MYPKNNKSIWKLCDIECPVTTTFVKTNTSVAIPYAKIVFPSRNHKLVSKWNDCRQGTTPFAHLKKSKHKERTALYC
jgi:hypothetical protein